MHLCSLLLGRNYEFIVEESGCYEEAWSARVTSLDVVQRERVEERSADNLDGNLQEHGVGILQETRTTSIATAGV
jgi:hypothetical protein